MEILKSTGTLDSGNLLVSMPQTLLHDLNKLLVYYHENEEQKKIQTKTPAKEFLSPEKFAKIVDMTPRTIRDWCKQKLKPATIKHGRLLRIEKNLALELLEEDSALGQTTEDTGKSVFFGQSKKKRKRISQA